MVLILFVYHCDAVLWYVTAAAPRTDRSDASL